MMKNKQSGSTGVNKTFKRMNTFIGTCEYMAPEIIAGTEWQSNECDFWSLGVILYKFFAQQSPFVGEFEEDTLQKIQFDPVSFPAEFPEHAKDLWFQLLEKNPYERIGWGPKGSEKDMFALKSHPFFEGIDFDNLYSCESPVPIPVVLRSTYKQNIINKYKNEPEQMQEVPLSTSEDIDELGSDNDNLETGHIDDWSSKRSIDVLYKGTIKYRSKMFLMYRPIDVILTDEPAMYLYKQNSGNLKRRYELQNWTFIKKNSKEFKIVKNGESKYRHIGNKFKIIEDKSKNETETPSLLELLQKFTIK